MSKGSLKIERIAPRPEHYQQRIKLFARHGGWLTALHESQLVALRSTLEDFEDDDQIELMPFPALLGRVLRFACIPIPTMVRDTEMLALIEVLCKDLEPDSPLGGIRELTGLHEALRRTLRELRHWQVTPTDLRQAAFFATQPEKLLQLAEFFERLNAELETLQRCTSTELLAAVQALESIPDFSPRILILCGKDPLPDLLGAIPMLVRLGAQIELLVDDVAPTAAFESMFKAILGRDLPPKPEIDWYDQIFSSSPPSELHHPELKAVSVPDPVSEVNWALRECLKARSEGILEHRMGIVVPDRELYVPLLLAAAPRYLGDGDGGKRPALDARLPMPLLANGFSALVLQCLRALGHQDVREMPKLLASSYFRLPLDDLADLKRACQKFIGEPGDSWHALSGWSDEHEDRFASLRALLDWRNAVVQGAHPLTEWHAELTRFTRLELFTERLNRRDDWRADADRSAVTALMRSLGGYASVMVAKGAPPLNLRAFASLAERIWNREEIAVPTRRHGIRVVSSAQELGVVDLVIVLNAVEGVYPRRRSEEPILFDSDRKAIRDLQQHVVELPDSHTHAAEQRPAFLRLCAAARRKLVFFCPRLTGDRRAIRSGYVEDLLRSFPQSEEVEISGSQIVPDLQECLVTQDFDIRTALNMPRIAPERPELKMEATRAMVRPKFDEGVSYKVLSSAAECPFRAVAGHVVGLRPAGMIQHLSALFRIADEASLFHHDQLEFGEIALKHAAKRVLDELATEIDATEHKLIGTILAEAQANLIKNEVAAREYWQPESISTQSARLEDVVPRPQVNIGGQLINLTGKVDGVANIRGKHTLRFYTSSSTLVDKYSLKEESRYWVEVMLLLATLLRSKDSNVALEFQSVRGGRKLYVLRDETESASVNTVGDIRTEIIPEKTARNVGIQNMREYLKGSVAALSEGKMAPSHGPHCDRCDLGELCRWSQNLVEHAITREAEVTEE